MGATVAYAADSVKIDVYFKNLKYMFDGVEKQPAGTKGFIYDGTTYVPLRFVGEALGKEVTWQGETETIWVGQKPQQQTTAPKETGAAASKVNLTDLPVNKQDEASSLAVDSWSTGGHNTAREKTFKINGKTYSKGIGLYLHQGPYPPNVRVGGTAQYLLSGKYTRLTGFIGAAESTLQNTAKGTLTVIGDGKELLVITDIAAGQEPKLVDVDLTGVQVLRINFNSNRKGLINMILAEPQLVQANSSEVKDSPAKPSPDVYIVTRNRTAEYVAIKNGSKKTIDLQGWKVVSADGNETYTFEDSFVLGPGSYVFLTSGNDGISDKTSDFQHYARSIVWSVDELWNDASSDDAQLYDAEGSIVSEYK
jgi:hypothetical protein